MDDELGVPRAPLLSLLKAGAGPDARVAKDLVDTMQEACKEFVHLVSSEAGQVAEEAKAKCVSAEHVLKAVERLEFTEYLSELRDFVEADREHRDRRRMDKKKRKNNVGGMSEEEAIALQQKLFAEARAQASGKL